jgi:hypothetical protein
MIRRLTFSLAALFLNNYITFQIAIPICLSIASLSYKIGIKPFEDPYINKLEVFNELTLFIISMTLPIFSDFVDSYEVK